MFKRLAWAVAIWGGMVCAAVINGTVREYLLNPWLGEQWALPLSGVTLSVLILLWVWSTAPFLALENRRQRLAVGAFWVALTLVFELGLGHYLLSRPWPEVLAVFDVGSGNLFVLALLTTLLAPVGCVRSPR